MKCVHTNIFLLLNPQPFDPERPQTCLFCIVGWGGGGGLHKCSGISYSSVTQSVNSLDSKNQLLIALHLVKRGGGTKKTFNFGIVSKCAHSPAVCYSAVGLTGHVSPLYNRESRSGTIVWMVGVKGQALAALGITASVALQKRLLILGCLLCTQCYSPGASAFHRPLLVPQRGIRWAIETSQTPSAVIIHRLQPSRDSLSAVA